MLESQQNEDQCIATGSHPTEKKWTKKVGIIGTERNDSRSITSYSINFWEGNLNKYMTREFNIENLFYSLIGQNFINFHQDPATQETKKNSAKIDLSLFNNFFQVAEKILLARFSPYFLKESYITWHIKGEYLNLDFKFVHTGEDADKPFEAFILNIHLTSIKNTKSIIKNDLLKVCEEELNKYCNMLISGEVEMKLNEITSASFNEVDFNISNATKVYNKADNSDSASSSFSASHSGFDGSLIRKDSVNNPVNTSDINNNNSSNDATTNKSEESSQLVGHTAIRNETSTNISTSSFTNSLKALSIFQYKVKTEENQISSNQSELTL